MLKSRFIATSGIKMVVGMFMVCLMALSLVGCGGNTAVSGQQSKITTEELSTEDFVNPVDEPNQEIDPGVNLTESSTEEATEATTEATTEVTTETPSVNNGDYKYTIYDGLEVSLPFDIEDYKIVCDDGTVGISIVNIARDYGWVWPSEDDATVFYYDCGDYWVRFSGVNKNYDAELKFNGLDRYQIESFHYGFTFPNSNDAYYSSSEISGTENTSVNIYFNERPEKSAYEYLGTDICLSKDDAIVIAYFLSIVKTNPGKNPLAGVSGANNYLDGPNGLSVYYLP